MAGSGARLTRGTRAAAAAPLRPGPVRFLPFAAASPARNMAIDRALLFGAAAPTLRLYAWSPPGVSLGWFQREVDRDAFERAGYEVVRRVTGGGAVIHHHEVTYSVVLPATHPMLRDRSIVQSYDAIHAPIREALRSLGLPLVGPPAAAGIPVPAPRRAAEPTLCFERTSPFDILVAGRKAVGSAQRRLPDRVLQHGSIILDPNPLQPLQPSLSAIAGRRIATQSVVDALEAAFAGALGPLAPGSLSSSEEALVELGEPEVRA